MCALCVTYGPRQFHFRTVTKNLTEAAQIADWLKGYCEDLYYDQEGNGTEQEYWEQEPPPLRSEVARAIRQTASPATGPDDGPAELFKAEGETALDRMHRTCVAIWETDEWSEEWAFSTFIPLPKKGNLKQCENYTEQLLWFPMQADSFSDHSGRDRMKTETDIADE